MSDMWDYSAQEGSAATMDLVGYSVEATDGGIGKIDDASYETGAGYVVVDTGPWIFGKKVLLPAGLIEQIDTDEEKVYVNRSKDEIKDAPEFDPDADRDEVYRDKFSGYYGGGAGPAV